MIKVNDEMSKLSGIDRSYRRCMNFPNIYSYFVVVVIVVVILTRKYLQNLPIFMRRSATSRLRGDNDL